MRRHRLALAAVLTAVLVTGVACGGDDDSGDRGGSSRTTTTLKCDDETVMSALQAGEDVQRCVPGAP
jgi:hypothetical protein